MTTMADVETVLDEAGVRMRGAHIRPLATR